MLGRLSAKCATQTTSDKLYLDASVLVALILNEPLSARADALLRNSGPVVLVSDFAAAEFASALGRRVRTGQMTAVTGRLAFANMDAWAARTTQRIETTSADVTVAEAFLRRLDLTLRTPDALNIALAQRESAALAAFDAKMATAARTLGTDVAAG
jgi:predicted nucleic acid-binding protein